LHNFGFPIRITNLSDKLTHFYLLKSYNGLLNIYHYSVSTSGFSARALYQTHPFAGTLRATGRRGEEDLHFSAYLLVALSPCRPVALSLLTA
jgi:hypothetical protein